MPQVNHQDSTLVIGLGRFGTAVAATLDRLGREVLAVEHNPNTVRQWSGRIPLIEADATDMEALEQLGATEFGTAVVGVASSLEASVLITSNLVELGIGQMENNGFSIIKMRPPHELHGFTIGQSKVRSRYGVTIIGLMSPGEHFEYATPQTMVGAEDILVVGGDANLLEHFANRP